METRHTVSKLTLAGRNNNVQVHDCPGMVETWTEHPVYKPASKISSCTSTCKVLHSKQSRLKLHFVTTHRIEASQSVTVFESSHFAAVGLKQCKSLTNMTATHIYQYTRLSASQ